ncbi:DUF3445 domain-containing protein [Aquihabitans sp. G128]|uniref:heme-dependent oxidative N-demethylase family protein n=1 Tax=Aquihabitans sp. G128 TaxID=2849779 RepID=UPI001C22E410|nr:DUF3445 domain-containing protein [Aquihabitans sp. G128]QXC63213.1 DUF3445 domain-containing protein [Aquihabitans sp. G128]
MPLFLVALAAGSAAPVLVLAVVVLLVLPALATLGDSVAHRLRAEHGVASGWVEKRLAPGALAPARFVRNLLSSTVRSSPLIGIGAVLVAGWYGLDRFDLARPLLDLVLRGIGVVVVGLTVLTQRDGSPRFRTGLGLDELTARWVPEGRDRAGRGLLGGGRHARGRVAVAQPGPVPAAVTGAPAWLDELALPAEGPPWLAMGLGRIPEPRWLLPDERRDEELAERHRLLAEQHDEVVGCLPGTEAAGAEVLDLVRAWEQAHRPDLATVPVHPDGHPLEVAARRTQEDLVLMVPHGGAHHLDAAVLCFPSHWRLADKLGGSAAAIHGPVPRYADDLVDKVDRFLDRLRPDVLVARRNWSVHDDPALFSPDPPVDPRPATADEVGDRFWLRSERQTLRRLPQTGAVLFTIRVQQVPFHQVAAHRPLAASLAARLAVQPPELTAMNGLAPHRDAVLAWLRAAT